MSEITPNTHFRASLTVTIGIAIWLVGATGAAVYKWTRLESKMEAQEERQVRTEQKVDRLNRDEIVSSCALLVDSRETSYNCYQFTVRGQRYAKCERARP